GLVTPGERMRIAATTSDPEVFKLLADNAEPLEVQLLLVMNPHAPEGILKAYRHVEHPMLRAAAEWNLANRPPTTEPATQPATRDVMIHDIDPVLLARIPSPDEVQN